MKKPSILNTAEIVSLEPIDYYNGNDLRLYNKVFRNSALLEKSKFHYNLKEWWYSKGEDPFRNIPMTFFISNGVYDDAFSLFTLV